MTAHETILLQWKSVCYVIGQCHEYVPTKDVVINDDEYS